MNKTLNIPKFLYEIHGDKPTAYGLVLTYVTGLLAAAISGILFYNAGFELWKVLLVGFLFFDVAGGVVSNFTRSTNLYYQRSENQRIFFLLLHVLQPVLLALLVGGSWAYFVFISVYTVLGGLIVNAIKTSDRQYTAAAFLTTAGIIALTLFGVSHDILYAFGALFIVKILMGFAVRRS